MEQVIAFFAGCCVGLLPLLAYLFLGRTRGQGGGTEKSPLDPSMEPPPAVREVLSEPPAVSLEEVPPELTVEDIEEIGAGKTPEERTNIAGRFTKDPVMAEAYACLSTWRARPRYRDEMGYQGSLRHHFRKTGLLPRVREKERISWTGDHAGATERAAVPDFVLNPGPGRRRPSPKYEGVLIEIKGDLSNSSEVDRALGQMLRYLLAWRSKGAALLVVCGEVSPEFRWLIRHYVGTWRSTLQLPICVHFMQARNEGTLADAVDSADDEERQAVSGND